jgi:hypothetical protein
LGGTVVVLGWFIGVPPGDSGHPPPPPANKKADEVEPRQGFDHVGLLVRMPHGTIGLTFARSSDDFKFNRPAEPI